MDLDIHGLFSGRRRYESILIRLCEKQLRWNIPMKDSKRIQRIDKYDKWLSECFVFKVQPIFRIEEKLQKILPIFRLVGPV